ncbi:putative kinesin family protein [Myxozyma melibiosi]|uniref:Kinesin family protein n=1 Tax=Myxozyma melibiosi TaxID=54550 RepID=A0ABR1F2J8_9ASCO
MSYTPARDSPGNSIKVVARFRPPNATEIQHNGESIVQFIANDTCAIENSTFTFDRVFGVDSKQAELFDYSIKSTVDDILHGYNGTVFAYGQTGSGKSYSMMGPDIDGPHRGIIPRIVEQIFASILESPAEIEYTVRVSYMEIYMERIKDLLQPINDNLPIHEDKSKGIYVKGLSEIYVSSVDEVYDVMRQGATARAVASTNMNQESSRSHSIFALAVTQKNVETGSSKSGQLFLVDLAGSEKVGKTGASGQVLEEAKKINKSLSALGNVINALTDGKSTHVPYRDSKLTRILQESLGGNSRTTLIVNCSPSIYNMQETLSTLKFGMRAKTIKNRPKINAELSPTELKMQLKKVVHQNASLSEYAAALEKEVQAWRAGEQVPQESWASKERSRSSLSNSSGNSSGIDISVPSTPRPRSQISAETPARPTSADDTVEEYMRRENEMQDRLSDRETAIDALERMIKELNAENLTLTEREAALVQENEKFQDDMMKLKQDLEKLQFESREAVIAMESLKELNAETTADLDNARKQLYELELQNQEKIRKAEERDRRKREKMREMASGFEFFTLDDKTAADENGAEGEYAGEKRDWIGEALALIDNGTEQFSESQRLSLKMYLLECREFISRAEQVLDARMDEMEDQVSRREEIDVKLKELDESVRRFVESDPTNLACLNEYISLKQSLLESQLLNAKRDLGLSISDNKRLRKIIASGEREQKQSTAAAEPTNGSERLSSASSSSGSSLSTSSATGGTPITPTTTAQTNSAPEVSPMSSLPSSPSKSAARFQVMKQQLNDFETVKRSLMRDLQNRCERVVELEIQLDELQEQNTMMTKNTSASKGQLKRMAFLERNLEQLTQVQRALVDQNAQLKREVAVNERKLRVRNEKISALEQSLSATQERLAAETLSFEKKMSQLVDRYEDAKLFRRQAEGLGSSPITGSGGQGGFGNQRIVKPLRGGGGGNGLGSSPLTAYMRGGSSPENNRLDSSPGHYQSSPSASKRTSWFSRN